MNRDRERRLERLEQATAPPEARSQWRRIIVDEGEPLPPDIDPDKPTIVRVIVDPKRPEEL